MNDFGKLIENAKDQYNKLIIINDDRTKVHDPDSYEAWCNRSAMLINIGQYSEAIIACDKAIKINPDNPWAWDNRKVALERINQENKETDN